MLNSKTHIPKPGKSAKRYPRTTFRLGDLSEPLEKRADHESRTSGRRVTPSAIIKRALRHYLAGGVQHFDTAGVIEELKKLRLDLSRVGGNLNQLAHTFNIYGQIDEAERDRSYKELRKELRDVMDKLEGIEREIFRRR